MPIWQAWLMTAAVGLLIAPGPYHPVVYGGRDDPRLQPVVIGEEKSERLDVIPAQHRILVVAQNMAAALVPTPSSTPVRRSARSALPASADLAGARDRDRQSSGIFRGRLRRGDAPGDGERLRRSPWRSSRGFAIASPTPMTPAPESHNPLKTRIPNRQKRGLSTALSGKIDYFQTRDYPPSSNPRRSRTTIYQTVRAYEARAEVRVVLGDQFALRVFLRPISTRRVIDQPYPSTAPTCGRRWTSASVSALAGEDPKNSSLRRRVGG
jgi:hypothetical protein